MGDGHFQEDHRQRPHICHTQTMSTRLKRNARLADADRHRSHSRLVLVKRTPPRRDLAEVRTSRVHIRACDERKRRAAAAAANSLAAHTQQRLQSLQVSQQVVAVVVGAEQQWQQFHAQNTAVSDECRRPHRGDDQRHSNERLASLLVQSKQQ